VSPSRDRQHTVRVHGQQQVTCNDHAHAQGLQHTTRTYRPCVRTVSNTVLTDMCIYISADRYFADICNSHRYGYGYFATHILRICITPYCYDCCYVH